jgi:hypothetical protein
MTYSSGAWNGDFLDGRDTPIDGELDALFRFWYSVGMEPPLTPSPTEAADWSQYQSWVKSQPPKEPLGE